MSAPANLADALVAETRRVRDVVMPAYQSIGPAGAFAISGMRRDLGDAVAAALAGDVVEMLRVLEALKGWET